MGIYFKTLPNKNEDYFNLNFGLEKGNKHRGNTHYTTQEDGRKYG